MDLVYYRLTVSELENQISVSNDKGSNIKVTAPKDSSTAPPDNAKGPRLQLLSKKKAALPADRAVKA